MKYYTAEQTAHLAQEHFAFLEVDSEEHILTITLAREQKKNALHPQMINEIAFALNYAFHKTEIWAVLIQAKGSVFCAGADLKAFAGMASPHDSTIPPPAEEILIAELFTQAHTPIVAKITGDVYAGGFFFLAGSQIVLAQDDVKFGLPEVKRGLYPFQVMAALMRVMPARKVIDWCIRGYNLPVLEAERFGLVTEVCSAVSIDQRTEALLAELTANSPTAIRMGLQAYAHIQPSAEQHAYLLDMLKKTIMTQDGQEGLKAFREKRKPVWKGK